MPIGYHPDFGTDVRYEFDSLPDNPDQQVRATMRTLLRYLRHDAGLPFFQQHALEIAGKGPDPITAVWNHIKQTMRFQQDADTADKLQVNDPRKEDTIEVLIRPVDQALLIMLRGIGVEDCDGYELYAGCLLTALGVPANVVTIAANQDHPGQFTHVYLAAYPQGQNGVRIPLDFSHGKYVGWEARNTGRLKEWPIEVTRAEIFWESVIPLALLSAGYLGMRYLNRKAAA